LTPGLINDILLGFGISEGFEVIVIRAAYYTALAGGLGSITTLLFNLSRLEAARGRFTFFWPFGAMPDKAAHKEMVVSALP
jgi:hypothetical protein